MIDFRQQPHGYKQGIYDLSFDQYRRIPALNSSKLKILKKSPIHFKTAIELPETPPTLQKQKAFDIGKVFDAYILDGGWDAINKIAIADPGINKNKNEYKEWIEKIARGKIVLKQSEINKGANMAEAAFRKTQFSKLFEKGYPHRVIIWQDPATGLWCKAEIDWITAPDGIVVDLKSTADAGFWFFRRNAERLGYFNQGAFYLGGLTTVTGYEHDEFLLAAVEKDPPFESHIFRPSRDQLGEARQTNEERMQTVLECLNNDQWPGYPDEIMDMDSGQYEYNYDEELEEIPEEELHGF